MDDGTIDDFSFGIYDVNHESISFGEHFDGRSSEISEIVPNRGTPPHEDSLNGIYDVDRSFDQHFEDLSPRISDVIPKSLFQKDSTDVTKSTSSNHSRSESTSSQYLSIVNKWPENENTHLIGDIKNWSKYRPIVDRSINFTELIEEKTIYEQSQTLRPYVFPSSPNNAHTIFKPIDDTIASLPNGSDGISFKCLSSTRDPKSNRKIDDLTQFTAAKPASSGISLKVPTRAALGDVTSLIKNVKKPHDLPALSSQKWVKNLTSNVLMPVKEVHNKMIREQSNGTHTAISKIPILVDRPKTSVPKRSQSATNHSQPASSRGNRQTKPSDDIIELIDEFPLKSNKSELIWPCTPLKSSGKQSFLVKNILNQPLRFNINVNGHGFHVPMNVMDLEANECREIKVTFRPSLIGKALGTLVFKPVLDWRYVAEKERTLYLCAYGGTSRCIFKILPGVRRASDVNVLLNIEELEDVTRKLITCKGSLTILNPASVSGAVIIFAKPKMNTSDIHETQIYIGSRKFVCHPNEQKSVTISCSLRCKELEWFKNQSSAMIAIAKIKVIFGSEPDRQRIAAILTKCHDPLKHNELSFLMKGFPEVNADEFDDFRGRLDHLNDLWANFEAHEIPLVISRTKLNETINSTAYLTCMDI